MFKVNNLTVFHEHNKIKTYLLNDVCFSISDGECLGIIGKSGDGKSTLAKALLNIYDNGLFPESGDISLNNKNFNNTMRGKEISILFQNPNSYLNPLMKVGKQIEEILTYHFKYSKKIAKNKVIDLMNKVNLFHPEKIYNYYPFELSGGMQQKICLCIAIICNPKIIIIDEGTSYLDFESKREILNLIKSFQKELNFSLIMISHDLNELYYMCDKIAIMRKGHLIELGNKNEIIFNPIHPYTIELLLNYLNFYENTVNFVSPLMNIELEKPADITMISDSHFVRNHYFDKRALTYELPSNLHLLKEKIYEHLRNEKYKYLP